jgi:ubiquinone/menaquinone biosynthesis C-methylase UbiE
MNKNIFLSEEGNNYFKRNINKLSNDSDIILKNFNIKNIYNKTIIELGCSNGWRLNEMNKINPSNSYIGLDPSEEAVNYGKDNYENIKFLHGTLDNIDLSDNSCDIILIPFVLMYVDRNLLLKSINEIDRILKNNGLLIITDFYSNRPRKNGYKHFENTFIYKQNYFEIFTSTNNYFLQKLDCFTHNTTNNFDNYDDNCFYCELKKDIDGLFV